MSPTPYHLRAITSNDALPMARLWRQCSGEVAQYESIFMPVLCDALWAEKLSQALSTEERFG